MAFVRNDRQRIFFEECGGGAAVVLGHSFLCSGEMWRGQVPALAESYRVVNVDYRGHGQSGPISEPLSLYDLVDDTVRVLDHLEIEQAVWAGLSIGGMVALRAALTVPERVRGLILVDTHAGAERPWKKLKYGAMGIVARLLGLQSVMRAVLPIMFGRTTMRCNRELVDEWAAKFSALDLTSTLRGLDMLVRRDDLVGRLGDIGVPALVLVGEEDRALPVELSREIEAGVPDSRLETIPEAGHLSALEKPQAVTRAMLDFLAALA